MYKIILAALFFLNSFYCFSQLPKKGDKTIINTFLSLEKTEKGYVFTDNNGHKSQEYTYVYLKDNGFAATTIVPPPDKRIIYETNQCYTSDNTNYAEIHILSIMKELKIIDAYLFQTFDNITIELFRNHSIADLGYAVKDGKYAMITNKGEFLTELKYRDGMHYDDKPLYNYYKKNGKWISAVINNVTGKEMFATKEGIVQYWSPCNYLIKNKKDKLSLIYNNTKHTVPQDFSSLINIPIESAIFTYNNGFFDMMGKKIESTLYPKTNFFKGHCIVLEITKEEQKFNYYGEALPQRETRQFKIINEKFETVKLLPEINDISSAFSKYGQVIVMKKYEPVKYPETSIENDFVIDYNGNTILPSTKIENKIIEVYDGLYLMLDKTYPRTAESRKRENFYNQKGEKILNDRILEIGGSYEFKEAEKENYIVSNGYTFITLDKNNNITDVACK